MKYFNVDVPTPVVADGLVFYCDGSSKPNPGFIGAGIHGYAYNEEAPKKGTGLATHTLTKDGYIDVKDIPKDKAVAITPLLYYNIAAPFNFQSTNNVAELLAAHVAIRIALACKVKRLLIKTDSEYTIKVLTKFAAIWVRSNWLKRDGTPVSNQDFIKDILVSIAELESRGIKLDMQWVKGHSTYIGNNAADKLSRIGTELSKQKNYTVNVQEHPAEGYWKNNADRHPMISHRRAYFTSYMENIPDGMYFIGDHGKDDDFVGRAEVDNSLAVIHLKNKEPVLDTIIDYCKKKSPDTARFFFARLDSLFTKNRDRDVVTYKEGSLITDENARRLDITSGDDVELVRELQPIRLSERTFEALAELQERLQSHISGKDLPRTIVTDVTDLFYDVTRKIVKNVDTKIVELKKKYVVGYRSEKIKIKREGGESEIILTFGIDIPDRNSLKRMESLDPTVKILAWMESDHCVRTATVITTNTGDYGIWCGYYSNLVYIE